MESSLFKKYQEPIVTKITNTRQLVIADILNEINKERPTTFKNKKNEIVKVPKINTEISIMRFCMKISHVSESDLLATHKKCMTNKLEKRSTYSLAFFGSLKPVDK